MGFLLGAYGKLMAAGRVRSIQARLMSIQSQMTRAHRQAANMEKYINNMSRNNQQMLQLYTSNMKYGMNMGVQSQMAEAYNRLFKGLIDTKTGQAIEGKEDLFKAAQINYNNECTNIQMSSTQSQQMMDMMLAQYKNQMEQEVEMLKETQLEPLKQLEEDLEQEKLSLESELKLAEQQKEACEKMEDAGVKNLVPKYTGQG